MTAAARSTPTSAPRIPAHGSASCCRVDVEAPRPDWRVALTGLRNPWRFAFDPALGELWIGDVGQDDVEEVNRVLLEPDEPPKNLGWDAFEGDRRTGDDDFALDRTGELVWPVAAYTHEDGCSVTGGYVYQGTALAPLQGRYLYGDFCTGTLWSLKGRPPAAPATSGASARRCRSSRTSARTRDGEPVFASAAGAIYRAVTPAR